MNNKSNLKRANNKKAKADKNNNNNSNKSNDKSKNNRNNVKGDDKVILKKPENEEKFTTSNTRRNKSDKDVVHKSQIIDAKVQFDTSSTSEKIELEDELNSNEMNITIPSISLPANLKSYVSEEQVLKLLHDQYSNKYKGKYNTEINNMLPNSTTNDTYADGINNVDNYKNSTRFNNNDGFDFNISDNVDKFTASSIESCRNKPTHMSVDRSLLESLINSSKYPLEIEHGDDGEIKLTRELLEYLVMAQGVQDGLNDFALTDERGNMVKSETQTSRTMTNSNVDKYNEDEVEDERKKKEQNISNKSNCKSNNNNRVIEITSENAIKTSTRLNNSNKNNVHENVNYNNNNNSISNSNKNSGDRIRCREKVDTTHFELSDDYFPPLRCVRTFSSMVPIPFTAFDPIRRSKNQVKLSITQEENVMRSFDKLLLAHRTTNTLHEFNKNANANEHSGNVNGTIIKADTNTDQIRVESNELLATRPEMNIDKNEKMITHEINEPLPFVSAFFDQHCPEVHNYLSGNANEEFIPQTHTLQHVNTKNSNARTSKFKNCGATYLMLAVLTGHTTLARRCLEEGCANPNNMSFLRQVNELADFHDGSAIVQSGTGNITNVNTKSDNSNSISISNNVNMCNHVNCSNEYNQMRWQMQCNELLMEMKHGYSPLFMAVIAEQLEVAELLYQFGGSVHIYDRWGRTPLHAAIALHSVEVIQWLLSKGAPRYVSDCFNSTFPLAMFDEDKHRQHSSNNEEILQMPFLALCGFSTPNESNSRTTTIINNNSHHHNTCSLVRCAHNINLASIPSELSSIPSLLAVDTENVNQTCEVELEESFNKNNYNNQNISKECTTNAMPTNLFERTENTVVSCANEQQIPAVESEIQNTGNACCTVVNVKCNTNSDCTSAAVNTVTTNAITKALCNSVGSDVALDHKRKSISDVKCERECNEQDNLFCHCHSGRFRGSCGCADDMFIRWKADRLRLR